MGFVDKEKLDELADRLADKFREIGLTPTQMQAVIDPESGDVILHSVALVRETAYRQITEDLQSREALNRIAAADHQMEIDKKADAIVDAIESGRIMDVMRGKEELIQCSHERIHEGLCLDCQEEVEDEAS